MKNTTRGESQKNNKMKDTSEWISWEDNEIIRMEKKLLTQSGFGGTDKAIVRGKIDSEFVYSHKIQDEKFYRTIVRTKRLSGTDDFIPIIVSETLIEPKMRKNSLKGKFVQVLGRFKSHNEHFGTDIVI